MNRGEQKQAKNEYVRKDKKREKCERDIVDTSMEERKLYQRYKTK